MVFRFGGPTCTTCISSTPALGLLDTVLGPGLLRSHLVLGLLDELELLFSPGPLFGFLGTTGRPPFSLGPSDELEELLLPGPLYGLFVTSELHRFLRSSFDTNLLPPKLSVKPKKFRLLRLWGLFGISLTNTLRVDFLAQLLELALFLPLSGSFDFEPFPPPGSLLPPSS